MREFLGLRPRTLATRELWDVNDAVVDWIGSAARFMHRSNRWLLNGGVR